MEAHPKTISAWQQQFVEVLSARYPSSEAVAIFRLAAGTLLQKSNTKLVVDAHKALTTEQVGLLAETLEQLTDGKPLQYILGSTQFAGLELAVTEAVLIPRPETEELVAYIAKAVDIEANVAVWDIGTGSGCIALALQHLLPNATVCASDVSPAALETAQGNANRLKLPVQLAHHDILSGPCNPFNRAFDVMVSNPPYVREAEKSTMEPNVLAHEPHLALFVPDNDPLRFYRAILHCAETALKPGGMLWFEINEALASELIDLINCYTFDAPTVLRDLQGKHRMICTRRLR